VRFRRSRAGVSHSPPQRIETSDDRTDPFLLIVIPGEMWFPVVSGTGDTAAALGIEVVLTVTMLGAAYLAAIHFTWPVALIWI